MLQSGTYPQCYKSGTATLSGTHTAGTYAYDFMAGTALDYNHFQNGDFYATDSDNFHTFYANNSGQQGVVAVSSTAALLSVPIPSSGFTKGGVTVQLGGTYVSYARTGNTNYYIVMRVTALPSSGVTFDWVLVYRPPGAL